jgi:hypothetical protein
LTLPKMIHEKRITAAMAETIWDNLVFHSKKWRSAAEQLQKLQKNQVGFWKY